MPSAHLFNPKSPPEGTRRPLATLGILVVRFAHRRLVCETDEVRREILAFLASHRQRSPTHR
ncbi:hypothetical protein AB0F68_34490 [Micromonospora sp. NPDC023966]|uniref:hypothetical protein n=1 Tax=Micromonospora sp. NPDC023966 TaxID=3154699 RepID=UPI0033F27836